MFGKGVKLFELFGFEVRIDSSWILIAVLVTWSLADGFFPARFRDLSKHTYWIMGIVGAAGLFLSVIVHEFAHSLVARRSGLPMKGITLFIFGGVAEMSDEPPSPKVELLMAIVGPLSSVAIGVIFLAFYTVGIRGGWPIAVNGVLGYIGGINMLLAVFNLIPAFPLDGGRVLRSILWMIKGNMRWATRVSSSIGSGFGIVLMLLGALNVLGGNFTGGIWSILIGIFLQNAARMSYQQLLIRQAFEGLPVSRFMTRNPVTAPPSITLRELVEDYIYNYHFNMFPVVDNGTLLGCVSTSQIKAIPKEKWDYTRVSDLAAHCSPDNVIEPDADTVKALSQMSRTGTHRLLVSRNGDLEGVISLEDLLAFFALKMELHE